MVMSTDRGSPTILRGVGVSPGIAIGPAFHINKKKVKVVRKQVKQKDVESECQRFQDAVSKVRDQMKRLMVDMPEELREHAAILESHLVMLKDRMLFDRTLKIISEEHVNAEWALEKSLAQVGELFRKVKDPYIRQRIEDVEYVASQVILTLSGRSPMNLSSIDERVILVAHDLSPADTSQIRPNIVLAFVTDVGSRTSHTAIVAKSLGIPAVVGLESVSQQILSGETIIVDGISGEVVVSPDQELLEEYKKRQEQYARQRVGVVEYGRLPAETKDGFSIKIKANIEFLDEIGNVLDKGAEGIGLFRTEFLYLQSREIPSEETLFLAYKDAVEKLAPNPVTIRTLDIGGDKFASDIFFGEEDNPALGLRAIRLCLRDPELFRTQLRAILRASAYGNVKILFPLISGHGQTCSVKKYVDETKADLKKKGIAFDKDIQIGLMIEVPTAVIMADILAKEVDFFSIGTNDLIQYSLAIDRGNEHVAHLYEPLHPGVLRMIYNTVNAAHSAGIEVAICGEMGGELAYVPILVGMGLDELSMNPQSIPQIKQAIRESNHEECTMLVHKALMARTAREVKDILDDFIEEHYRGLPLMKAALQSLRPGVAENVG